MKLAFDFPVFIHSHYHVLVKINAYNGVSSLVNRIEKQIMGVVQEFQKQGKVDEVVLCLDDTTNFRSKVYPGYKANRINKLPFEKQDLYPYITMDTLLQNDLEADDLLWLYSNKYDDVIIITEDKDQLQSVQGSTRLFFYKKKELISEIDYIYEGFKKVLLGCSGDNIPKALSITENKLDKLYDGRSIPEFLKYLSTLGYVLNKEQFEQNKDLVLYDHSIYEKHIPDFDKVLKRI